MAVADSLLRASPRRGQVWGPAALPGMRRSRNSGRRATGCAARAASVDDAPAEPVGIAGFPCAAVLFAQQFVTPHFVADTVYGG